jgi:hypothetical protein
MKKFVGLLLALAGGAATLWGGYRIINGESGARLHVTEDFSLTAMTVALIGVLVFTIGLVWNRD